MQRIVRWSLENKSVVILATILLIGSGAYATTRLNQELLPDISFPIITISTPVAGAGPDLVDEQVTQPVEDAIDGVEGIESVRSTSSEGFSVVLVEFDLDADTEEAESDLQAAIDGIQLPSQAGDPEVRSQSASQFPIMSLSLAAKDQDLADLTEYAEDDVVSAIEEVDGVASVDVIGGAERRIQVDLDPDELKEKGLSTDAVVGAISGARVDAPVGSVSVNGRETPVNTTSELGGISALEDLPVGVDGGDTGGAPPAASGDVPEGAVPGTGSPPGGAPGGASAPPTGASPPPAGSAAGATTAPAAAGEPVLLGDVAEVREVGSDLSGISRTNGEPSVGLNVIKETDTNTVEVAAEVERVLDGVREEIGRDQVVVVANTATDVEESVSGLVEEALVGAVLAILVIFAFLRSVRATLVTAVSLPTSVLAALLFSWVDNLTLNVITLAGLTIAVGRVVDDAIVVLENSYRYVQNGYEPEEAALKGTTEVASAITSSTLTMIAVFAPLALVGGIVSRFFVPLSLTVALALIASLVVAVTIIPVLVSIFLRRRTTDRAPHTTEESEDSEDESTQRPGLLVRLYTPMLRWSLRHRLAVLLLALLAFGGGLGLVRLLPVTFFPPSEERLLIADVELPAGTALGQTSDGLRPFEDFLQQDAGIKNYQVSVGGEDTQDPESPFRPANRAQAFINVRESSDVSRTLDRVDREGDELYGDNFQVQILSNGPPQGGLEAVLTGGSKEDLARAADLVTEEFRELDDVNNVESDLSGGNPEIEIEVDPEKAAKAGLSPGVVSGSLASLLGDSTVTTLGDAPVVVGVPASSVDSLDEVRGLPVGSGITVGDVAEVREVESPAAVSRTEGERAVTVTGAITSTDTQTVSTEAQRAIADLDLPANVAAQVGGENEDIDESFRNLFLSIIVALVLVFLLLVVFFGSLRVPLVILLAVPLTTVGVFGALYLTNTAISVPSLLGILLLIGIVVSNAILLVDFAIKAQDRYETSDEAILAAGKARLRPILMTAFATIFALLPLALGLSGGGNGLISSSLAITVVGGLATSTFLTLLVVPVGYSLLGSGRKRKA
ncbi:MAG: efflux RND transporter permease subunit [Actinomycetota bacterium]|nr:efflux RND transporter permease subunit [Actinomycetota bacterium]